MIDQELLKKLFHYDEQTGVFKRIGRLCRGGKITPCDFVGTATSTHGYLQYTVRDKTYDVHRLIFMYMYGRFPHDDVDHIDGDRRNNALSNLRIVSRSDNLKNIGRRKYVAKSGHVGVGFNSNTGKYRVWIQDEFFDGFETVDDAITFRKSEEVRRGFSETHYKREAYCES